MKLNPWTVRSESLDGGKTWSEGVDSKFRNPNSAIELLKLKSGNLLLIFNDSMSSRTPLVAALSKDNDKSWPFQRSIAAGADHLHAGHTETEQGR